MKPTIMIVSDTITEAKALRTKLHYNPSKVRCLSFAQLAHRQYEKLRGMSTLIIITTTGIFIPEHYKPRELVILRSTDVLEGLCLSTCLMGQCLCERSNLRLPPDPYQLRIDEANVEEEG